MSEVMAWTEAERLSFAALLEDLDEHEWSVKSLCTEWTVREVAAHLTMSTRLTLGLAVKGAIRSGFSFDRMENRFARERAVRFTPAELIAQIRETAASPRLAPGARPLDPLTDALVHGQDIAWPLGRERPMPLEPALAALEHVRTSAFYGARKRFRGLRLVATDADWAAGDGPEELRGSVSELLLLATGRPAGLAGTSGPAVARVEGQLKV